MVGGSDARLCVMIDSKDHFLELFYIDGHSVFCFGVSIKIQKFW